MSTESRPTPIPREAHRPLLPEKARKICSLLGLEVTDSPLLRQDMTAEGFLTALIDRGQLADAVTFMSCALPKREALWWAGLCVRDGAGADLSGTDAAALTAAERWVRDPSEENRRAAMPAAQATDYATPSGFVALGAYFSGGSMAPPEMQQPVPPADHFTAQSVRGAVMLAAVAKEPEAADEKYRRFLQMGLDVAYRRLHWDGRPEGE